MPQPITLNLIVFSLFMFAKLRVITKNQPPGLSGIAQTALIPGVVVVVWIFLFFLQRQWLW